MPDPDQLFADEYGGVAPALFAWAHLRVRGALRGRLDADDLVQEIAVRAFAHAADYDPARGTFRQWLFGFAYRVWLEVLRELTRDPLGRHHRKGGDSQLPGIADSITAISRRIALDEAMRTALRRLEDLPEDDRDLLIRVGLEGLSHSETAALLGIGEDASRKRWQRLRERLHGDVTMQRLMAS